MTLFRLVEGEQAVISVKGVYKQCDVYTRNGYLYAQIVGGYIKLNQNGSTSHPTAQLDSITWEGHLFVDKLGRLCTDDVANAKQLPAQHEQKLLGIEDNSV